MRRHAESDQVDLEAAVVTESIWEGGLSVFGRKWVYFHLYVG